MSLLDDSVGLWDVHHEIVTLLREEIKRLQIQLAIVEEENKKLKLRLGDT